ncbi:hypothetical protein [Streptomyces sp. NPDC088400]|uniref:hypothetical protein n=1 Tax=Streptomyces sp. NPDC088400 TaxID=3365861 RepID=UPI003829FE5A
MRTVSKDLDVPRYRDASGAARIAGSPYAAPLVERLAQAVTERHPEYRYATNLVSTEAAVPLLCFGGSLLSVLTRPYNRDEQVPFKKIVGVPPATVRIARITPLDIYVHESNALTALERSDTPRVFLSGDPAGDLDLWSQLGLGGALGAQRIDTIASAEHRHFLSGGVKASGSVEQVVRLTTTTATDQQTLDALAANPAGIAVAPAGLGREGVRPVGLAAAFPRRLLLVLRRRRDGFAEPAAVELARYALSEAGQAVADELAPRFARLTADDLGTARAELEGREVR